YICLFFFSSRRRHTRFDCDWSSDVCSSDLRILRTRRGTRSRLSQLSLTAFGSLRKMGCADGTSSNGTGASWESSASSAPGSCLRSEERRVGKECRSGGGRGTGQRERGEAR